MIKNIFFLHRFHFNRSYYKTDDFQYFKDRGYNVKYLDLVGLLKASNLEDTCPEDLKADVIYINTKSEFRSFLQENKENSLLLTCVGFQVNSAWFYRILSKSGMPYVFLDVNFFPKLSYKNKVRSISTRIKRFFEKVAPVYLFFKLFRAFDYLYTKSIVIPASGVIHVKDPLRKRILKLCNEDTTKIKTKSNDWRTAMDTGEEALVSDDYLVFIDQYIPYHPDFVSRGIDLKFTPKEYYEELNNALDFISKKTGLKVQIAAHPRRVGEEDYNFPLNRNATANLVKHSKLVLAHYSTAVNFAAIHRKPLAFLNSDLLNRSYVGTNIDDMAFTFSKESIDITSERLNEIDMKEVMKIDDAAYTEYILNNLSPENSSSARLGELVEEIMESKVLCIDSKREVSIV